MRSQIRAGHPADNGESGHYVQQSRAAELKPQSAFRGAGRDLFTAPEWQMLARALKLSGRELEIVQGIADNLKESAIALRLQISMHTVHSHMDRLHHKLQVNGRCEILMRLFKEYLDQTSLS